MDLAQFQVHADLERSHWWFLGRRHLVKALLNRLVPAGQGRPIVDVGCGTGGVTDFFSKDYACTGIDPTEEGISFAKQRFPHARFIRGNAPEDVQTELAAADAVLLLEVLEHVEQDRAFVQSLLAAMKPGAVFVTMAPADKSLWSPHDAGFGHYRRYDDAGFRALWAGAPVEELLVSPCNSHLYLLAKLVRFLARKKGSAWGPGDTDLAQPIAPVNALLAAIFRAEAGPLLRAMDTRSAPPFRKGVSLIAVLRKTA